MYVRTWQRYTLSSCKDETIQLKFSAKSHLATTIAKAATAVYWLASQAALAGRLRSSNAVSLRSVVYLQDRPIGNTLSPAASRHLRKFDPILAPKESR